jgi:hypothetical protein
MQPISNFGENYMPIDLPTTPTKLKLIKQYLPSAGGLAVLIPSLLVPPSYRDSLVFHLTLTLAWLYWVFTIYKIEYALNKMVPGSNILPKRTWLMSLIVGSHPTNYLLLVMALVLSSFKQTPLTLILTISAPVLLVVTFTWYASIFGALRKFINDRLPESERLSAFSESAIGICLGVPALICFAMQMIGQTPGWIELSFLPIGIAAATSVAFCLQKKLATAILVERANMLEAGHALNLCAEGETA